MDIKSIGFNLFTFTFKTSSDTNKILKDNPWVVRNNMLSLQKRKPYLSDNEVAINSCDFWVQFHNIPIEGRIAENIRLMAGLVGRVVEVENPEDEKFQNQSFGRAKVEIDVEKPLILRFLATRPGELDEIWIQVKYEKLVRYCFNCGRLGHQSKTYKEDTVEFTIKGTVQGYDAALCAQVYREQGNSQGHRNQWKTPETEGIHGEERRNYYRYGEWGRVRDLRERGERIMVQRNKEKYLMTGQAQTSQFEMED